MAGPQELQGENSGGKVRGAGRTQPHQVWSAIQGSGLYSSHGKPLAE